MLAWGVTDGSAGMAAQVRALGFALGVDIELKTVRIKKSCVWLPNVLFAPLARFIVPYAIDHASDSIAGPPPDLVISCGRRGAIVAMGLRRMFSTAKFIHIQDPHVSSRHFDLVVAMQHDHISGPNVLKMRFALHAITPQRLAEASAHFTARFASYPKPYTAVLIGGSTNKYALTTEAMAQLVMALSRLLGHMQGSLLITPSRRTGEANIAMLRSVFANNPRVYMYDDVEENPYMGMLALADSIIATDDSVNMMSEAVATGKPLYLLRLPGHSDTKPSRFADDLIAGGMARVLGNRLEAWDYEVPEEMPWLAEEIRRRLSLP